MFKLKYIYNFVLALNSMKIVGPSPQKTPLNAKITGVVRKEG